MEPYVHKVQYYETDMMGISHHANYARWMEEARIDFMDRIGYPYAAMEAAGVVSPVRAVSCQYKKPSTFGDTLHIAVAVESFNGVLLTLRYLVPVIAFIAGVTLSLQLRQRRRDWERIILLLEIRGLSISITDRK